MKAGFSKIQLDRRHKIYIDAGSLIYSCAYQNRSSFDGGDYVPALRSFLKYLLCYRVAYKWKPVIVFDGRPPPEKAPEHQRRASSADHLSVTSLFIAMCVLVCRRHYFEYVVAPFEADVQAGRGFHDNACTVVILTGDSDLIAYGNKIVVVVKSWFQETYRYFDMRLPVTEEVKQNHPLYNYYHSYGVEVIHWWAAVMGCDISLGPTKTGIKDAGASAFLSAMQTFDGSTNRPNVNSFARALLQTCSKKVTDVYSLDDIVGELIRVSNWFGRDGQYYDKDGNYFHIWSNSSSCKPYHLSAYDGRIASKVM